MNFDKGWITIWLFSFPLNKIDIKKHPIKPIRNDARGLATATFAERLVEKRAITFCNGDLAQSAVLGSPQEEQLCKTDPDTKRAA
jgi:hypothetical protein